MVIAGAVTLAVVILLVGAYIIWQPAGQSFAADRQLQDNVDSGAKLYTIECSRCHGPTGAGQIGPNLHLNELAARYKWNPNDPADLAKLRDLVTNTITHGRPQTLMPAWGRDDGGPLNATQISNLADLIMTNSWSAVVPAAAAASAPTAAPAAGTPLAAGDAKALMTKYGCGACHTIAGVPGAFGTVGPNLSHEGTVPKIPATSQNLDNTPENMQKWVHDAPSIKPGVIMPNFAAVGMSDLEAKTIADYLETLK
jgi:mono/diheme cytochrome c family protein